MTLARLKTGSEIKPDFEAFEGNIKYCVGVTIGQCWQLEVKGSII